MWRFPLLAALVVAGCGAQIGDACTSNIDCSPLGTRFCDTASTGGYCTEEDCGIDTCPGASVCVRFFTVIANEPCHFDASQPFSRSDCANVDERCVCDVTDESDNCTAATDSSGYNGHCAPSATERHWCMRSCSSNGDCRDGYECRRTGTFGAEPISSFDMAQGSPAQFCAPKPTSF